MTAPVPAASAPPAERTSLPCPVWKDWGRIVKTSPTIHVLVLTGAAVACALTGGVALYVTAGVVAAVALGILIAKRNKISFEWTSRFQRAAKVPDQRYHEIPIGGQIGARLFLGSIPNKLARDGDELKTIGIGAILSVNEEWEHQQIGYSCPYSDKEYKQAGVERSKIDHKDHTPLAFPEMDKAADFIDSQIREGKNVYVHCRAGVGRSAMAVAAYLIKYKGMKVNDAMDTIKQARPESTIKKKEAALKNFYEIWEKVHKLQKKYLPHTVPEPGSYISSDASSS